MLQLAEPPCCLSSKSLKGAMVDTANSEAWLWVCAGECWGSGERPDGGQQFQDHVGGVAR